MNQLYYGDNLQVMRESLASESVDLIYLDPQFNSKRDYNLLFKTPKGQESEASVTAFQDTWHWGQQAENEFDEVLHQPNTDVAEISGCGTAVHAAEKLNRKWIGIDITHLAISLIEKRLKDAFGSNCKFDVLGTPQDLAGAQDLAARNKYQFQWWAVSLVDAQPFQGKKKGADGGIDGIKIFYDLDSKDAMKIVVSVKAGNLKADDVRALNHVREREKAEIALFICLMEPTQGMKADAAAAGFYTTTNGKKHPRVQLLTIDGLLLGTERAEHPDYGRDTNFKKAKPESNETQGRLL